MVLDQAGRLGLGTPFPIASLDIFGTTQTLTIGQQVSTNSSSSLRFLGAWGNAPMTNPGGYAYIQANSSLNALNPGGAIRITRWGTNTTTISALEVLAQRTLFQGRVGINTGLDLVPTADLDVSSVTGAALQLRFRNLPAGGGNMLVVDNQGYVFVCPTTSCNNNPAPPEGMRQMEEKMDQANAEIAALKEQLNLLLMQSISSRDMDQAMTINPNPSKGNVDIAFKAIPANIYQVTVIDATGKEIMTQSLAHQVNSMDIQHLPNGVYYFRIAGEGNLFCKKIILEK